jgi:hypothetical protein
MSVKVSAYLKSPPAPFRTICQYVDVSYGMTKIISYPSGAPIVRPKAGFGKIS